MSPDEIKYQIDHIDVGFGMRRLVSSRSLGAVPSLLEPDESLLDIVAGDGGVLVATSARILHVKAGWLGGLNTEDMPYERITSFEARGGVLTGSIEVRASSHFIKVGNLDSAAMNRFAAVARARMSQPVARAARADRSVGRASTSVVADLERLATLKEWGVLTEREFLTQKARMLAPTRRRRRPSSSQ